MSTIKKFSAAAWLGTVTVVIPASGQSFEKLLDFGGARGEYGSSAPVIDSSGALYGTTRYGGTFNRGTLYRYQSRVLTTLHNFNDIAGDGNEPQGTLVGDSAGIIYGTAAGGGADHLGVVYRWDPNLEDEGSQFRVIHELRPSQGAFPLGGLTRDADGYLYVGAHRGGSVAVAPDGCGTLFRITPSGVFEPLKTFSYKEGCGPYDVTRTGSRLVGGTLEGGEHGEIFSIPAIGGALDDRVRRTWDMGANFSFAPVRRSAVRLPGGDPLGTLYGAAGYVSGGYGALFKITPDTTSSGRPTYTYTILHRFHGWDGSGPSGHLILDEVNNKLYGVTVFGGAMFDSTTGYSQSGFGTVFEFDLNAPASLPSSVRVLHSFVESDGAQPMFGVTRDASGNLYGVTAFGGTAHKGVLFRVTP